MSSQSDIPSIETFYDQIAGSYDNMTSLETRLIKDQPFIESIIDKYKISSALDAGAGTGFHSILLASLGVRVTAVDISNKMLQHLSIHARERKLRIKTVKARFSELSAKIHQKFDAVFCMGNSIAHAASSKELSAIIYNFRKLLNPHGAIFIQLLNYDRILSEKEVIQNIRESGNEIFIRFYGFSHKMLDFNILRISRENGKIHSTLQSISLRPITQRELVGLLKEEGFKKVTAYGSIAGDRYSKRHSKDLFLIAQ